MNKNDFFYKFKKTISDFEFYKSLKNEKIKTTLSYLSIILLVFSLVGVFQLVYNIVPYYDLDVPEIRINDGIVEINESQPFIMKQTDNSLFVIDNSGTYTNLEDYKEGAIVLKDEVIIKGGNVFSERISLVDFDEFTFNKKNYNNLLNWIILFASLITILFYFIGYGIYSLFFGLVIFILASIMKIKINYRKCWVISAYALTPVLFFGIILNLFQIQFILRDYLISLIYIWGILHKIK